MISRNTSSTQHETHDALKQTHHKHIDSFIHIHKHIITHILHSSKHIIDTQARCAHITHHKHIIKQTRHHQTPHYHLALHKPNPFMIRHFALREGPATNHIDTKPIALHKQDEETQDEER